MTLGCGLNEKYRQGSIGWGHASLGPSVPIQTGELQVANANRSLKGSHTYGGHTQALWSPLASPPVLSRTLLPPTVAPGCHSFIPFCFVPFGATARGAQGVLCSMLRRNSCDWGMLGMSQPRRSRDRGGGAASLCPQKAALGIPTQQPLPTGSHFRLRTEFSQASPGGWQYNTVVEAPNCILPTCTCTTHGPPSPTRSEP